MNWSKQQLLKMRRNIHLAAQSVDDTTALETPEIFPGWEVDTDYTVGYRVRFGGNLYRCEQAHRSQSDWAPDVAASLWAQVAEPGDGTKEHPIAYNGNMALEQGKYYIQFDVVYICIRDTQIPVYNNLADLVGNYVEVYNPEENLESMLGK